MRMRAHYRRCMAFVVNAAAAASAIVCVAAVALWIHGYHVSDQIGWDALRPARNGASQMRMLLLESGHGGLAIRYFVEIWQIDVVRASPLVAPEPSWRFEGFSHGAAVYPRIVGAPVYPRIVGGARNRSQNRFGFGCAWNGDGAWSDREVLLPYWFIVPITAILPALMLRRFRRRWLQNRRKQAGKCARCGYDLRATPSLCPECGLSAA